MDENTWERNGDQGQRWIKAEVNIPIGLTYQVTKSYLYFYMTENFLSSSKSAGVKLRQIQFLKRRGSNFLLSIFQILFSMKRRTSQRLK